MSGATTYADRCGSAPREEDAMSIITHKLTTPAHSGGEGFVYRALFACLFTATLPLAAIARLTGRGGEGGLLEQARQSAHASAGYAVRY